MRTFARGLRKMEKMFVVLKKKYIFVFVTIGMDINKCFKNKYLHIYKFGQYEKKSSTNNVFCMFLSAVQYVVWADGVSV